jgi:hypothetical protein
MMKEDESDFALGSTTGDESFPAIVAFGNRDVVIDGETREA